MSMSMGIRNRRGVLQVDVGDTHSIEDSSSLLSTNRSKVRSLSPVGIGQMFSKLQFPISSRIIQAFVVAARIPFVRAGGFGDEVTNNLISDIGPLLSLFGERVTQQYMSQSMDPVDHWIFAAAPLGIVTAVVGAIRVGGGELLRSIIGRARERRADVEIELMSSTSTDVCEIWDGSAVVRTLGTSPVIELIYVVPNATAGSDSSPLLTRWEDDAGIYDFDSAKRLPRNHALLKYSRNLNELIYTPPPEHRRLATSSAPNLSLNMEKMDLALEKFIVSQLGLHLQLSVIMFALLINFSSLFGNKLQKADYQAIIYAPLLVAGTGLLAAGMIICIKIVDYSTDEEVWDVKRIPGGTIRVAWLQKGGMVGDQLFNAYALFPSSSKVTFEHPRPQFPSQTALTAARTRLLNNINSMLFMAGSTGRQMAEMIGDRYRLFRYSAPGMQLRTSRPKSTRDQHFQTRVAVCFSLCGFFGQFLGLRGLHWSVTVMQLGATVTMTILRSWVRRNLIHEPVEQKLVNGYELDWMAKNIMDCTEWRVVTWGIDLPRPSNNVRAANVLAARVRLGALTRWPSQWQYMVNSTAEAIASSMNFLFSSPEITVEDINNWATRDRFEWHMTVEVKGSAEGGPCVGGISLSLVRNQLVDGSWGAWKVSENEIGAVLSLWMLHFHNLPLPAQGIDHGNNNSPRGEPGLNGSLQVLRVLGLYDERALMDYEQWIARQTHPVVVQNLDDFLVGQNKQWKYVIGNPTNHLGPWAPVLGVITSSSPERLCGQSIYAGFMSAISEHVKIGSKVKIRWANRGVKDSFGFHCAGLDELAGIVEQARLANIEEAYMCIVPSFSRLNGLPPSIGDKAVLVDIVEAANHHAQEKRLDHAELFLLWLHYTAERMASIYKAQKRWIEVGKIYSDLRSVCEQIDHPLAADSIDEADKKISVFCETVLTMITLDSGNGSERIDSVPDWMAELLGENATGALENWKQANAKEVHAGSVVSQDEQLCKAATNGNSLLVGQLLAKGANIDGCLSENGQQTSLILACIAGHGAVTQYLLMEGADRTAQDYYGRTALHYAAAKGHTSIVRILVQAGRPFLVQGGGPLVNILDKEGQAPLDLAVSNNVGAVVDLLIFYGANDTTGQARKLLSEMHSPADTQLPSAVDGRLGWLPVHWAAWIGSNRAFRALLDNNFDIEPKDILELTPLHIAAMNGSLSIVEMLLQHPVIEVDAKDSSGRTALHHAASCGQEAVVRLLLQYGADMNTKDVNEEMPLHKAVTRGEQRILALLLDLGADQETRYSDGGTLLHKASSEGHFTTTQLLLSRQADVHARDLRLGTAVHRAACAGHEALVGFLLDQGADIHAKNDIGEHALHQAASEGFVGVVELLLNKGANQEATDGQGETILHRATSAGHVTTLSLLLDRQADCHMRYPDGESLLQKAAGAGHHGIVQLLLGRGQAGVTRFSGGQELLCQAARNGYDETVKVLLAQRLRFEGRLYSEEALEVAAINGQTSTVQLLLDTTSTSLETERRTILAAVSNDQTSTVEVLLDLFSGRPRDLDRTTLLCEAAINGHINTVKLLLDLGADTGRPDRFGSWPLHCAARNGHTATVELLLDHGADIDARSGSARTVLQIALWNGNQELVQLLRDRGAQE